MSKQVLSIGQCGFDHAAIAAVVARHGRCATLAVADLAEARKKLADGIRPALILVNRKLDLDGGDGLEIIRALKADPTTADLPVMLVSNYSEYQSLAVAAGALDGFGKSDLHSASTFHRLQSVLA